MINRQFGTFGSTTECCGTLACFLVSKMWALEKKHATRFSRRASLSLLAPSECCASADRTIPPPGQKGRDRRRPPGAMASSTSLVRGRR